MAKAANPIPPGFHTITPHLNVKGAAQYSEFLQKAFGAVDALWRKAIAAGCTATMPLADQFWGDRYGQVKDPFGFNWSLVTRKEDLTPAEAEERQRQAFSRSGGGAA
ncbi:MAG TPA: VOC family protein [Bryobacteraceae bacterium]|nr:VOC family protein [Bryobacteraceae bacterium]